MVGPVLGCPQEGMKNSPRVPIRDWRRSMELSTPVDKPVNIYKLLK